MDVVQRKIAIIGGGPAGLRAAEVAVGMGASVTLYDAKPSVGRKFLVAGKSGLNLTNSANFEDLLAHYSGRDFPMDRWRGDLGEFGNYHFSEWASGIGVATERKRVVEGTMVDLGGRRLQKQKQAHK